jgi:hypothetical protein
VTCSQQCLPPPLLLLAEAFSLALYDTEASQPSGLALFQALSLPPVAMRPRPPASRSLFAPTGSSIELAVRWVCWVLWMGGLHHRALLALLCALL